MSNTDAAKLEMLTQHDTPIRVRYDEADPMGFLHHANYLKYFEIGRLELFRASGGNHRRLEEQGMLFVVAKAQVSYHKPARYDDQLTIRTKITRISAAKIEHEYHLLRGEERLATGQVTLALLNRDGVAQRIPDWLQADVS